MLWNGDKNKTRGGGAKVSGFKREWSQRGPGRGDSKGDRHW